MTRRRHILMGALLLLACSAAGPAEEATPVRKLVVLPFAAPTDELGQKVAMKFRYKFRRTELYEVPSEIETNDAVEESGIDTGVGVDQLEVGRFARDYFIADLAIYGSVLPRHLKYKMIRCSDKGVTVLLDKTEPYTDERSISFIIEDLLDDMHDLDHEQDLEVDREKDAPLGPNIVPNPGFEDGAERPDKWADVDNMVVFYATDDAAHGKVVMFDTDVRLEEYQNWKAKRNAGAPLSAAPLKTPPTDPGFDTVAGTTGAPYRSDYFPFDASKPYRLTFEMKGPGGAKLFVKGYSMIGGQWREVGRAYKACRRKLPEDQWETFTRTFHPAKWERITHRKIEMMRIQLFPYWPRGTYYYDNIHVQEILPKEPSPQD